MSYSSEFKNAADGLATMVAAGTDESILSKSPYLQFFRDYAEEVSVYDLKADLVEYLKNTDKYHDQVIGITAERVRHAITTQPSQNL